MQTMLVLRQLTAVLDRKLAEVSREMDLTPADVLVLGWIVQMPGISGSRIAHLVGRKRQNVATPELATVFAATPYMVWTPQPRSRFEVRTTRTSVERRDAVGAPDRELEKAGWSTRILGNLHLREELDLSVWLQEDRPDLGATVRDGRMELRATF